MEHQVTIEIRREADLFVAYCEEFQCSAKNITIEDALTDLQGKLHAYFQEEEHSVTTSVVYVIKRPI